MLTVSGAVMMVLRLYFMGYTPPSFSPADNPAADNDSFLVRSLTSLYLPVFNFYLLLCPVVLSFDWSMEAIPLVESLADGRVLVIIIFYSALFWLTRQSLRAYLQSTEPSSTDSNTAYTAIYEPHASPAQATASSNGRTTPNGSIFLRKRRRDSGSSTDSAG